MHQLEALRLRIVHLIIMTLFNKGLSLKPSYLFWPDCVRMCNVLCYYISSSVECLVLGACTVWDNRSLVICLGLVVVHMYIDL